MTENLVCSICKKPMIPAPEDEGCWVLDCTCHNAPLPSNLESLRKLRRNDASVLEHWAADEIERLTQDRDLWKERHDRERAAHAKNLTEQQKVEAERDRLRAAGKELADSSQAHVNTQREMIEALDIEVAYLRAALVRIANVEDRPAMIASQALGLVQSDETPKRAYYETHEPPHCPTCDCGRTP